MLSLAKKLNLSEGMISHYEKGINYPSDIILKKICTLLDLPYKGTLMLIRSEKAPGKTKDFFDLTKPIDPDLRNLLLDCYKENIGWQDKSYKPASKENAKEELSKFPLHPIEVILLKEIIKEILSPLEAQLYKNKPFDYFSKLSWKGQGVIVLQADLKWNVDPERCLIVIKLTDKEPVARIYDYQEIAPGKQQTRSHIINTYSEEYGENYLKKIDMIRELGTSPFHFFEQKVIQEIDNELKKRGISKSTIDSLNLNDEEIVKILKKVKFDWTYNQKYGHLLITFEKKKGESITKRFGHSWNYL